MPNEYVARYEGLSHEELWKQLKAGDPNQIDTLAAAWKSLHDTADGLATSLNQDLAKLSAGWSSPSGTEYQRRLGLVSSFSSNLATEFTGIQQGLTLMSGPLRTAQKQAEDPAAADNNNNLVKDAIIGTAIAGPVGGIVGGFFGHSQDEAEKEKARQRMVQLVAGLAADYQVSKESSWSPEAPVPPTDLPGDGTTTSRFNAQSGPSVNSPGGVNGTHDSFTTQRTVSDPSKVSQGPGDGAGSANDGSTVLGPDGQPIDPVTSLAGAGGGLSGAGALGAGALGVGGLAASLFGAGGAGANLGAPGAATASGYPLGSAAGATGGGPGSPLGESTTPGRDPRSAAGSRLAGRQSASGTGYGEEDEPDERLTWLTEDDMVWGTESGAPSVLGTRPAQDPDAEDDGAAG